MAHQTEPTFTPPIQTQVDINGISTNLLCQEFADNYLIIVTQFKKLGTVTVISEDSTLPGPDSINTHAVRVLLGEDSEITQVVARCCAKTCPVNKPVLVAAALKDTSKEMVNSVCRELERLQQLSKSCAT